MKNEAVKENLDTIDLIDLEAYARQADDDFECIEQFRATDTYSDSLPALTRILNDWMHCGGLSANKEKRTSILNTITNIQELLINLTQSDRDCSKYIQEQVMIRVD